MLSYETKLRGTISTLPSILQRCAKKVSTEHQYVITNQDPEDLSEYSQTVKMDIVLAKTGKTVCRILGVGEYQLGFGPEFPITVWITSRGSKSVFLPFAEEFEATLISQDLINEFYSGSGFQPPSPTSGKSSEAKTTDIIFKGDMEKGFAWFHKQKRARKVVTLRDVAAMTGYSYSYVKNRHAGCQICVSGKPNRK